MNTLTDEQYKIIGHTLGVNTYHAERSELEKDKYLPSEFYRNYYCAGEPHSNYPDLDAMTKLGIMDKFIKFDQQYFYVTEMGIREFKELFAERVTSKYKRPSKGRQKYLDYIHSEYSDDFSDYLGIKLPRREWDRNGNYRFVSTKYIGVRGDWKPTLKEAKTSYKEKLKEYKRESNALVRGIGY